MKISAQKQAAVWMALFAIFGGRGVRAGINQWTRLGPEPRAITALAIDPKNPATVYAATGSGLFKSADEGLSWSAVNPGPPCCTLTLVINPRDPATIYALSGRSGIFKTADGGATWIAANSGLPIVAGNYGVISLAMDPHNSSTLYAGSAIAGGGVFKTIDGGENWNLVSSGLPDGGVMALALDPQNEGTIYASTRNNGVFQSNDVGASWYADNSGLGFSINRGYDYISVLAIDPQNPNTMYAAAHYGSGESDSGLFVTRDAGANWRAVPSFSDYNEYTGVGIAVTAVAIDSRNAGTAYAGSSAGLFKTIDGGATWSAAKTRLTNEADAPLVIGALAIDPQDPGTVYAAGASAGILKTSDAGASWSTVNSELRATAAPGIVELKIDSQNPGTLYARTASAGLFKTTDTGASWTAINAGLPGYSFDLPVSTLEIGPGVAYAVDAYWQDIFKSTDGGTSWTGTLALDAAGLVVRGARLTASALALDPWSPRTIYAAGSYGQSGAPIGPSHGVYRSTDGGASWSWAGSGIPVSSVDQSLFVSTLAVDPLNPGTIYAGTGAQGLMARGNGVFITTNGGASWKSAGLGGGFSRVDILAIDPQHTSTVYARAVTGPPDPNGCCGWLFKTTDGGASWTAANSGLPNYITALAIDLQDPSTIYAGTRAGVYRSIDGGANWNAVNDGLTSLSVTSLAIDPENSSAVYAGTADGVFAIAFVP